MDSTPLPPLTGSGRRGPKDETPESGKPVRCDLCNVWCQGVVSYQSHIDGRQHFANLQKPDGDGEANGQTPKRGKKRSSGTVLKVMRCEICDLSCLGKEQLEVHLQGIKHAKRAKMTGKEELDLSTMPFIKELGGKTYRCTICNIEVTGKPVVLSHISGAKHQKKADPNTPKIETAGEKNKTTTPTGEPLECKVCKLPVNSLFQLEEHKKSLKHKHREEAYNKWGIKEANIVKDNDAWDPNG